MSLVFLSLSLSVIAHLPLLLHIPYVSVMLIYAQDPTPSREDPQV